MGFSKYMGAALLAAALAGSAQAGMDAPMLVADAGVTTPPRFISLSSARNGMAGVRVIKPLRSDRAAMDGGFMRLDRNRIGTVQRQVPVSKPVQTASVAPAAPVIVTRPEDKAVLDLFGDSAPVEPAMPARRLGRTQQAWPVPASAAQHLSSGYGPRKDPFTGKNAFHGGIDIAAPAGTPVLASADGVVTKVEASGRLGKSIELAHADGSESSYGHLSKQVVNVGQQVRQGQKLGEIGSTGRSTGPHLDYRLRRNGELVNPMTALREPAHAERNVASNVSGRVFVR